VNATFTQQAPKPVTFQPLLPPPALAKAAELKPAPVAAKLMAPAPAKPAETASASVSLRLSPPLSGETGKPGQAPKVLPPASVKAASAKPKDGATPGLRVTANAY